MEMSDVNSLTISGRLTEDPKSFSDGTVCRIKIANNRSYLKNGATDYTEETVFIEASLFSGLAKKALAKLTKGSYVAAQGRIELNRWTAEDGTNRSQIRMVCTELASERFFLKPEPEADEPKPRAPKK
jgi:single-strand DNA-binding protein